MQVFVPQAIARVPSTLFGALLLLAAMLSTAKKSGSEKQH
jgi:hypothetical protein